MGRWTGLAGLVLAAAFLPSTAVAAAVEGTLTVETGATFPPGTRIALPAPAAVLRFPAPFSEFELHAAQATVYAYEQTQMGFGVRGAVGYTERSWHATDVVVTLTLPRRGYIALEPAGGHAVSFTALEPVPVAHLTDAWLSGDGMRNTAPAQTNPYFERHFPGESISIATPGELAFEGGATMKLIGPRVTIHSRTNTTTLETGVESSTPITATYRWVYLELDDAVLRIASPKSPLLLGAVEAGHVAWDGRAHFDMTEGVLEGHGLSYKGSGPVELTGAFTASLYPTRDGTERLRLADVRGDLASTTLAATAVETAPAVPGGAVPLLLVGLAAVVAAGAGAVVLLRRRPKKADLASARTDEENHLWCTTWADWFEGEEDPAAALECLQVARRYEEEPAYDLLLWEASCNDRLGNLEEALQTYLEAVAVAPRGDAEAPFAAAVVASTLGRSDVALTHLRLALMGEPGLLELVNDFTHGDDDPFHTIRNSAGFRDILRDARTWARAARGEA